MREDNLLCLRRRKFVRTTDSDHDRRVYPNLACDLELSGIDQLWVADITYIRLETEFVYLAVVLDAFSRRVIGWALDRTLEDDLPLAALRVVLELRQPGEGLIHRSDRGVQYASHDYTGLLRDHKISISMSRQANPWDKSACESFMKTLKYEEVYRQEARRSIQQFLEKVYNQAAAFGARLSPAGGVRGPLGSVEEVGRCAAASWMSFSRHREIFRSDVGRNDPERISRSPAGSASASPTGIHSAATTLRPATEFQPTATSSLTACLSPWAHPTRVH